MNFNKRIDELNMMRQEYLNIKDKIDYDIEIEIQALRQKLTLQYKDEKEINNKKIEDIEREIKEYYKSIERYSLFEPSEIGGILSSLVSVFEGTDFVYKIVPIYKDNKFEISKPVKLIVSKKHEKDYYLSKDIVDLINKGKAIILDENQSVNGIYFYHFDENENTLKPSINLHKFPSIQEFIDKIISYKMDKKISKIPLDTLEIFKLKFISSKTNNIKINYELERRFNKVSSDAPQIKRSK